MQTIRASMIVATLLCSVFLFFEEIQASEEEVTWKKFFQEKKEEAKSQIFKALNSDNAEEELNLILKEININGFLEKNMNALMIFARDGQAKKVALLAKKGAKINCQNPKDDTALTIAIKSDACKENRLATVEVLLAAGAQDPGKNRYGQSIWTLAKNKPEILEKLKKHFNQ